MLRNHPFILAVLCVSGLCLTAQAQTPTISSLSNNAVGGFIFSNSIAPGELVTITGTNLGDATAVNCGSATGFTTTCGTVSVTVAGKAAGVRNEGAGGVIIEVPVDAPLGNGQMILTHTSGGQNLVSSAFSVTVVATAPEPYGTSLSVNGTAVANCFNSANTAITPTNPAAPGSSVRCLGTGFGVTNPVVPTGTIPPSPLPAVVASVNVTVGGQTATVTSTTVAPATSPVGQDQVIFTVPPVFAGAQPLVLTVGGVTASVAPVIPIGVAGPSVTSVSNSASNLVPGLPNAGIAQGSIFIAQGSGLGPANISIAQAAFQSTTLSGTSVAVTVGSTTVNAPMYYTSAGQIAALLPSNTPTGNGSFTVTYNNQISNAAPIQVVANNVGLFTLDSSGQGPGIVTYPDYSLVSATPSTPCGGANTSCGAANPGDTLILWATGLGPVNGSDAAGAGLGVAINVPLTLWLGGVAITPSYQGRSGCCIGEDQIVFKVPNNVPLGCAVPLVIQIGSGNVAEISNTTVMPIASGSRSCTATNASVPANAEQLVIAGPITIGSLEVDHYSDGNGTFEDDAKAQFFKALTYNPGSQPFFLSYVDDQPLGTCYVYNNLNENNDVPFASSTNLDAGSTVTLKGPNGSFSLPTNQQEAPFGTGGKFLVPGSYTFTGTGGADVGAFSASLTIQALPTLVSPVSNSSVTRANGMTVTWTGGSGTVVMEVAGPTDETYTNGVWAVCTAPASAGRLQFRRTFSKRFPRAVPTSLRGSFSRPKRRDRSTQRV